MSQTGQLVAVRDSIVSQLKAEKRLRDIGVSVSAHGGDFDAKDLEVYSKTPPALVLAVLRAKGKNVGGSAMASVTWGLVGLTKDRPAIDKHTGCLDLADRTLRCLVHGRYGVGPSVGKNDDIDAVNQYARELDRIGVAMWAFSWTQQIELLDEDVSVALGIVHVKYDSSQLDGEEIGDVPEAEDHIVLEQ